MSAGYNLVCPECGNCVTAKHDHGAFFPLRAGPLLRKNYSDDFSAHCNKCPWIGKIKETISKSEYMNKNRTDLIERMLK